ncbi:MAG: EAL and HDOD domain-containing protein [Pseudomonadota bacterium]
MHDDIRGNNDALQDVYIARQAVYDRNMQVIGYELLFRGTHAGTAGIKDEHMASSQVIINTFINIGLERLVGSGRAFINLPPDYIVNADELPMTPEQLVLDLPGDFDPVPERLAALRRMRERGYSIAFDLRDYRPELKPMLELADMVRLDIRTMTEEGIHKLVQALSPYQLRLFASKIETHEQFEAARKAGFEFFQGFFFSRPNLIRDRTVQANQLILLRILERLQDENASTETLERLIVQDATLTYKLLRYINSASYAMRRQIDSVREALTLVGTQTVRNWASLILLSRLNANKPNELLKIALIRARMGETLARHFGIQDPAQMFTVGLFSTLDALLDVPMVELLDTIALNTSIKLALLDHEGPMGQLLSMMQAYELGDWGVLDTSPGASTRFSQAYLEAMDWAGTLEA